MKKWIVLVVVGIIVLLCVYWMGYNAGKEVGRKEVVKNIELIKKDVYELLDKLKKAEEKVGNLKNQPEKKN
jgi:hypothetical protein